MIHHVYANRSNIGDWQAAKALQRLLGTSVVEHLCDAPFVRRTLERLTTVGPDDVVVVGAGGLFMDYFSDFWEGLLDGLPTRAPLVVWGVGVCAPKSSPSSLDPALLRRVVDRSTLTAVRDPLSVDVLSDDDRVRLTPCPSLAVGLPPVTSSRPLLLHATHRYTIGDDVLAAVRAQARDFARTTGRAYTETDQRISPDDGDAFVRGIERFGQAEVVVSSRLHGCLLALAARRPVIAISGDVKVDSFMTWAGLGNRLIDAQDDDAVRTLGERLVAMDAEGDHTAIDRLLETARRANLEVAAAVHELHDSERRAS